MKHRTCKSAKKGKKKSSLGLWPGLQTRLGSKNQKKTGEVKDLSDFPGVGRRWAWGGGVFRKKSRRLTPKGNRGEAGWGKRNEGIT